MLGQNVDSPSTGQYAETVGVPWVGYDSNAQKFAPKQWLTAAVYNWGPYYLKRDEGRDERHVEDGLLLRQPEGRLHEARAVRPGRLREDEGADRVAEEAAIKSGTWNEFSGPIYDQNGKLQIPKGKRLDVQRPVLDELAREGRHREPEGLTA